MSNSSKVANKTEAIVPIAIDNDVQMARKGRTAKWQAFPFQRLNVGQSFHLSERELIIASGSVQKGAKAMSILTIQAGKRTSHRFAVRTVGADDPRGAGVRIWRQADRSGDKGLDAAFSDEKVAASAPSKGGKRAQEPRSFQATERRKVMVPAKPSRRRARQEVHASA